MPSTLISVEEATRSKLLISDLLRQQRTTALTVTGAALQRLQSRLVVRTEAPNLRGRKSVTVVRNPTFR
jgi:hypothetical protein